MIRSKAPASAEYWKEQFGFVSTTVLVSGIALLKIWPYVAMIQTGKHIEGSTPEAGVFLFLLLTGLLSLGMTSVFFCILQIIVRGIWLGFAPYRNVTARARLFQSWLRTQADRLYI